MADQNNKNQNDITEKGKSGISMGLFSSFKNEPAADDES
jgi:hypothetical protein